MDGFAHDPIEVYGDVGIVNTKSAVESHRTCDPMTRGGLFGEPFQRAAQPLGFHFDGKESFGEVVDVCFELGEIPYESGDGGGLWKSLLSKILLQSTETHAHTADFLGHGIVNLLPKMTQFEL